MTTTDTASAVVAPEAVTTVTEADIPTIDFSPYLIDEGIIVGNEPTKAQLDVAQQIDVACRVHGFIHLINFGLTDTLREQCFNVSKDLFDMSTEHKLTKLNRITPTTNMGYSPYESEKLNPKRTSTELKEAFNIRYQPKWTNDFRGCPKEFENVVKELLDVMKNAAIRYAYACALALNLPHDFFVNTLQTFDLSTIRFLHSNECNEIYNKSPDTIIRVGEHTDFGAYTFLLLGKHRILRARKS